MSSPAPAPPSAANFPAAAAAELLNTYLIIYVGFVIATTLYGVTLVQGIYYFRTYTKDSLLLKLLSLSILIFDSMTTILPAHAIYYYLIANFGNFAAGVSEPVTYRVENGFLTLITLLVQSFYAHQIWSLSRNKLLTSILVLLVIVVFALGLEITVDIIEDGSAVHLASNRVLIVGGFVQGLAALCDIIITASLCWFLHSKRTGIKRTEKLLDRLIILAINRGLITTIAQLCFLILNVSVPGKVYWFPFHQAVGKLYTNSYLAMLNVRARNSTSVGSTMGENSTFSALRFESRRAQDNGSINAGPSTTRFGSQDVSVGDFELSNSKLKAEDAQTTDNISVLE